MAKAWSKWRELSGVMCDKKVPTKMKLQTVIRPTLLYGCETWPMSVKDEKRMATTEMRMVRRTMGMSVFRGRPEFSPFSRAEYNGRRSRLQYVFLNVFSVRNNTCPLVRDK